MEWPTLEQLDALARELEADRPGPEPVDAGPELPLRQLDLFGDFGDDEWFEDARPRVLVFAYGSNLDPVRMRRRCPGAIECDVVRVPGRRLGFAGLSGMWGGAVATLVPHSAAEVEGVLWSLTARDLDRLDKFEGVPTAYVREEITLADGRVVQTYVHTSGRGYWPSPRYVTVVRHAYARRSLDPRAITRALLRDCG